MEQVVSSTSVITYKPSKKTSYICRDLFVWAFFLLILPTLFLGVYYILKVHSDVQIEHFASVEVNNVNTLNGVEELNYMGSPDDIKFETYLGNNDLDFKDPSFVPFGNKLPRPLLKIPLSKYPGSLCNDGSPASYYLRLSDSNSKNWVIVLEGGYFCYDAATCYQRSINSHNFTSSSGYRSYRYVDGILSSSGSDNKYWSDANVVNVPYCSSDLWIGNKVSNCKGSGAGEDCSGDFSFLGQQILSDVFTDLLGEQGMKESSLVLLAGMSSGGIGAILNANRLHTKIKTVAPNVQFKVVLDSSWLLELPYSYLCNYLEDNNSSDDCIINKIFMNSINFWQAALPNECQELNNIWDCFIPHKLLPKLSVPVFVVQSLFDESQLLEQFRTTTSNTGANSVSFFKQTLQNTNQRVRGSLAKVSVPNAYFVTSCTTHMILTRKDFNTFAVGDSRLEDAIYFWSQNDQSEINRIEECRWPDCHSVCPRIPHPDNGELSVNPLEYFSYFGGISLERLAVRLGIRNHRRLKSLPNYNKIMGRLMGSK